MKIDSKLLKIFSSIQKEIKFVFLGEDLYTLEKSSDTLEKSPDAVKKLPQIPKTLPEQMLKNLEGRKCEYLMSYDEE
ncbi:hypothetical protein KKG31_02735 [Patescibacteria group bacterium]|nr:hypothetical protein [Patescibacteria group bacterium]MBU1758077.1 hypothetical protein [Patescibacteria group bacterium]